MTFRLLNLTGSSPFSARTYIGAVQLCATISTNRTAAVAVSIRGIPSLSLASGVESSATICDIFSIAVLYRF